MVEGMSELLSVQRDVIAQQLLPKTGRIPTPPAGTRPPQLKRPERSPDDAPELVKEIHSLKARMSATTRIDTPASVLSDHGRGWSGAKGSRRTK